MFNKELLGLTVALAVLTGCMGFKPAAPPVNQAIAAEGLKRGATWAELDNGRRLLAMRCTNCHSLEPISSRTPSEWCQVVEDMSERSGLSPKETEEITHYLISVRESDSPPRPR